MLNRRYCSMTSFTQVEHTRLFNDVKHTCLKTQGVLLIDWWGDALPATATVAAVAAAATKTPLQLQLERRRTTKVIVLAGLNPMTQVTTKLVL